MLTLSGLTPRSSGAMRSRAIHVLRVHFVIAFTFLAACGGGGAADGVVAPVSTGAVARFTSFELTPGVVSVAVGSTLSLTASARDDAGQPLAVDVAPAYSSADPALASVSIAGVVTGVAPGTTTVTASLTIAGVTKTSAATITVLAAGGPVSAATVTTTGTSFTPGTVTIPIGASVSWNFSGAVHNVTFTAAAPTGGSIPDQAIGSSVTRTFPVAGTFAFECTRHAGMNGSVVVQGAAPAVFTSLSVSPTTPSIAVGATVQLTSAALDQNGSALAGAPAPTYSSSASGTASVSVTGLVTGVAAGTATVTASLTQGAVTKTATATVTVTAPPPVGSTPRIVTTPNQTFAPASLTIDIGDVVTWQFSEATHNVAFSGPTPTGGDIPDTQQGNAVSRTFGSAGTYSYQCTRHSGMAGSIIVRATSSGGTYTSLRLTSSVAALGVGQSAQLTATPLDQAGLAMTGNPAATFTSSSSAIATVDGTGVVRAVAVGTAQLTATLTWAGVTKTAVVTIVVNAQSATTTVSTVGLRFTPNDILIAPGQSVAWQVTESTINVTFKNATPAGGNIPDTEPGALVMRTFPTAGTYDYECTRHSGMKGRVRVQ